MKDAKKGMNLTVGDSSLETQTKRERRIFSEQIDHLSNKGDYEEGRRFLTGKRCNLMVKGKRFIFSEKFMRGKKARRASKGKMRAGGSRRGASFPLIGRGKFR